MRSLIPGIYEHFKGGRYHVLTVAKHTETEEPLVVYVALKDGGMFARPLSMWTEEVLWPDGNKRSRFVLV